MSDYQYNCCTVILVTMDGNLGSGDGSNDSLKDEDLQIDVGIGYLGTNST